MPKHMTIINLACTITKLRKWGQAWKYSAESAQNAASQLTAEHERKLTEHRAAFGVRTEADAKIIAGLREELDRVRNSLGIQAAKEANKVLGMVEGEGLRGAAERVVKERDTLRAEVAELKTQLERLTSWAAKNQAARETLQTELERLKSQTPKHPVKVGEWVRRTGTYYDDAPYGFIAEVHGVRRNSNGYTYTVIDQSESRVDWSSEYCEPCDPPTVKREPEVGDTVQLVKRPTKQDYELSWLDDWGKVGESFRAVSGVCTYNKTPSVLVEIRGENYSWPLSCVEVVTEATHDTEAGKAAAKAVIRDSRSGEIEMCVGDEVEVIGRSAPTPTSGMFTGTIAPIGTRGTAKMIHGTAGFVELDNGTRASIQDVRKVTT